MWKPNIYFKVRSAKATFYTLQLNFSSPPKRCRAGTVDSISELLEWVPWKGGGVSVIPTGPLAIMTVVHSGFHWARNIMRSHVCKLLFWSYTLVADTKKKENP
jgi:hypothetical protein